MKPVHSKHLVDLQFERSSTTRKLWLRVRVSDLKFSNKNRFNREIKTILVSVSPFLHFSKVLLVMLLVIR